MLLCEVARYVARAAEPITTCEAGINGPVDRDLSQRN